MNCNIKDIKGYEGLYKITSDGKVWSEKSKKWLKPQANKKRLFTNSIVEK